MPPYARTAAVLVALLSGPASACSGLDWKAKPYRGEINFKLHGGQNTFSMASEAGGFFNLRDCGLEGEDLTGYRGDGLISVRPDLILHWNGDAADLVVGARFAEPVLLLVRDPEGGWHFDDGLGHAPLVTLSAPRAGDYAIYVGTHGTNAFTKPGMLIISETRP